MSDPQSVLLLKQLGAAVFYGASSLLIIMVNKAVLTSYGSVTLLLIVHCIRVCPWCVCVCVCSIIYHYQYITIPAAIHNVLYSINV